MKTGWLLLVLGAVVVLGGLVGTLVIRDPGYVLLAYGDLAIETSLWFAVVSLAALYFVIRFVFWAVARLLRTRGVMSDWLGKRQNRTAQLQTNHGTLLMAEDQWADAERYFVSAAKALNAPLVNYLGAARAAHQRGEAQARNEYLRLAEDTTAGSGFAVGLAHAEMLQATEQWEESLAVLAEQHRRAPKHKKVLKLMSAAVVALKDWQGVLDLLPELIKSKVLDRSAASALEQRAYQGLLDTCAVEEVASQLDKLPKSLAQNADLVLTAAERLRDTDVDASERCLVNALNKNWQEELVIALGTLPVSDPQASLKTGQTWQKKHAKSAGLSLTLGRFALRSLQWDGAREYLETSLRQDNTPAANVELGRLLCAQGDIERGTQYLNNGFAQGAVTVPDLPLPPQKDPDSNAPEPAAEDDESNQGSSQAATS